MLYQDVLASRYLKLHQHSPLVALRDYLGDVYPSVLLQKAQSLTFCSPTMSILTKEVEHATAVHRSLLRYCWRRGFAVRRQMELRMLRQLRAHAMTMHRSLLRYCWRRDFAMRRRMEMRTLRKIRVLVVHSILDDLI